MWKTTSRTMLHLLIWQEKVNKVIGSIEMCSRVLNRPYPFIFIGEEV
jgi:hypothetical protein